MTRASSRSRREASAGSRRTAGSTSNIGSPLCAGTTRPRYSDGARHMNSAGVTVKRRRLESPADRLFVLTDVDGRGMPLVPNGDATANFDFQNGMKKAQLLQALADGVSQI